MDREEKDKKDHAGMAPDIEGETEAAVLEEESQAEENQEAENPEETEIPEEEKAEKKG